MTGAFDFDQAPAITALQDQGFAVLPALLSEEQLAAALDHAERLLRGVGHSESSFEGRQTRRVYSILSDPGAFEPLLVHPLVRGLVAAQLGAVYQFGMLTLSAVDPGQGAQVLHFDAGVYPLPRDLEAETNVIWALDEFTADNGATMVAPGSHRWPSGRRPEPGDMVPVLMPAGSAVVYSGRLWHGAGHNRTESTRRALICENVLPWLRPADNHTLATGVERLKALSPELRRLAGVATASPYLGFVAGQDPQKWLDGVK